MPAPERVERTSRGLARERSREALAGRRWLLALLTTSASDEVPPPPALAIESWRLVLSVESAGLPASRAVRALGIATRLSEELVGAIDAAAMDELQRVMMARAQLLELDALAVELGVAPVVIKGGAVAMTAEPLDLGDVDVMLHSCEDARRIAAGLNRIGYVNRYPDAGSPLDRHLVRHRPGGLCVEVHVRADYGRVLSSRAPVEAVPGLRAIGRSAAADEAVRVLRHTVVKHEYRRGHLRDVVLLSQALRRCGAVSVRMVRESLTAEECSGEQEAMLSMAEAVAHARPLPTLRPDRFAYVSALRYEMRQRPPLGSTTFPTYLGAVQRSAGELRSWVRWAGQLLSSRIEPPSRWYFGPVRRVSPATGAVLGYLARFPYGIALVGLGAVAAISARWRALESVSASMRGPNAPAPVRAGAIGADP